MAEAILQFFYQCLKWLMLLMSDSIALLPPTISQVWVSETNKAILRFSSDWSISGGGFRARWHAVPTPGCPYQNLTDLEGVIISPNYPHFLLGKLKCHVEVKAPRKYNKTPWVIGSTSILKVSFFAMDCSREIWSCVHRLSLHSFIILYYLQWSEMSSRQKSYEAIMRHGENKTILSWGRAINVWLVNMRIPCLCISSNTTFSLAFPLVTCFE